MILLNEFIDYAIQFWTVTAIVVVILLEIIVVVLDNKQTDKVKFTYEAMPCMQPIIIPTKGQGIWTAFFVWVMKTRTWKLSEDFFYTIDGEEYKISKGFVFDGASVPKFLRSILSPVGILLLGGLIHDYGYKHSRLCYRSGVSTELMSKKELDHLFKSININVNGFKTLNYLTWYALRIGGFFAWRSHRKNDK